MSKKIAITVGEGIGPEIVQKALLALNLPEESFVVIDDKDAYTSLERACEMANRGEISALVTGPVSKGSLQGFKGQTEVLGKFLGATAGAGAAADKPEMLFIARDLRVMLLTRHLPLAKVPSAINEEMIIEKTLRLNTFLREKLGIQSPKIAFCALNPHAGEDGILGDEEIKIINPALEKLRVKGIDVTDALSADGLFAKVGKKYLKNEAQDYDAIISTYHDQALTAVKALAFDEVVNTTIGLKIPRTSPSCGTAQDIAGKGIADPKSMIEAIRLAIKLK